MLQHVHADADQVYSASQDSGSIWNAFKSLSCHRGLSNGIVRDAGRSTTRARIPMDW